MLTCACELSISPTKKAFTCPLTNTKINIQLQRSQGTVSGPSCAGACERSRHVYVCSVKCTWLTGTCIGEEAAKKRAVWTLFTVEYSSFCPGGRTSTLQASVCQRHCGVRRWHAAYER